MFRVCCFSVFAIQALSMGSVGLQALGLLELKRYVEGDPAPSITHLPLPLKTFFNVHT